MDQLHLKQSLKTLEHILVDDKRHSTRHHQSGNSGGRSSPEHKYTIILERSDEAI